MILQPEIPLEPDDRDSRSFKHQGICQNEVVGME
jgi:hypothetical protein